MKEESQKNKNILKTLWLLLSTTKSNVNTMIII